MAGLLVDTVARSPFSREFPGVVTAGVYYRFFWFLPGGVSSIGLSSFLRQSLQMSICNNTLAQLPMELQSVEKFFLRV